MKGLPLKKGPKEFYKIYSLILFSIFLVLFSLSIILKFWIINYSTNDIPIKPRADFKYPVLKAEFNPQISATGAIIMDGKTKALIYSKNPKLRFSPASTTKIMTAIVALDSFKLNDILTVKEATTEGSILGLYPGEQLSLESLLYALLLPSANDAALTIAQNYPGGEKKFIDKMNEKALPLSMNDSNFLDPAGLDDNAYSTAEDLVKLVKYSLKYDLIWDILTEKSIVVKSTDGKIEHKVESTDQLLGVIPDIFGGKTGYTDKAFGCMILVVDIPEKNDKLISIVLGSHSRFDDTKKLIDWVKASYRWE